MIDLSRSILMKKKIDKTYILYHVKIKNQNGIINIYSLYNEIST